MTRWERPALYVDILLTFYDKSHYNTSLYDRRDDLNFNTFRLLCMTLLFLNLYGTSNCVSVIMVLLYRPVVSQITSKEASYAGLAM